jgi:hypothetical protein
MKRLTAVLAILLMPALAAAAEPSRPKLSQALQSALHSRGTELVWVYFTDKGPAPAADSFVTPRARARRLLRGQPARAFDARYDAPLYEPYVAQVASRVARVRHASRWLGALSVEATAAQVA